MIKITDNNLPVDNQQIIQALAGLWGINGSTIYNGKFNISFIYSGTKIENKNKFKAMACVCYTDGTFELFVLQENETKTVKDINMGIIIAQN